MSVPFRLRRTRRDQDLADQLTVKAALGAAPKSHRGQVLVIFSGTFVVLMLMSALVIDLAWLWNNSLRIQRTADAAALAGVVFLPNDVANAKIAADKEATRNGYDGYPSTINGTTVTPTPDATNPRRLNVKVTAPVKTFFLGLIGMNTITVSRQAHAEYVLPVPMGSPLNYYGVYGTVRTSSGGTNVPVDGDTGVPSAASADKGGSNSWTSVGNVYVSDNAYASSSSNNTARSWGNFAGASGLPVPSGATIRGIELYLEAKTADAGCAVRVELSWNGGGSWTTPASGSDPGIITQVLATADSVYTLGGPAKLWGRSPGAWTSGQFSNSNFWVRLTNVDPGAACNTNQQISIDQLRVKVYYTSSVFVADPQVKAPDGSALTPQGFWAVMLSQGADSSSGDAYLPNYVQASANRLNPEHNISSYYDYAVETAAAGGRAWIFDPGFCNQGNFDLGAGDNYYGGTGDPVSSFYDLYDTNGTPYNLLDDAHVGTSGSTFRRQTTCDGFHNRWYSLPFIGGTLEASSGGLRAGRVYRLRASTYDPTDVAGQNTTEADNGFALLTDNPGGKIYGIGSMEMLTPLPGGQTSTFYLAQIEAIHASKTMEIRLWDPGDTNQNAYIQILRPTASGWSAVTDLTFSAKAGQYNPATGTYVANSGASNCNGLSSSGTDRVQTYQSSSRFNGCWLTINATIPLGYTAPQDGWWKISYTMQGAAGINATDITTWQVNIRGNPVHLVEP